MRPPRTAARRVSCLRQFYKFLFAENLRADDPTATLDAPKQGRSLPKYLTEAEVEALLARRRWPPAVTLTLQVLAVVDDQALAGPSLQIKVA